MLNPMLHLIIDDSKHVYLMFWVLSVIASVYLYFIISWVERSLAVTRACTLSLHDPATQGQPLELPRLKAAIRASDVASVIENATWAALSYRNADCLSPYELAELYGNDTVTRALLGAYRREHLMHMISDNIASLNREMPGWYFVE
jgi:hypothetical protein